MRTLIRRPILSAVVVIALVGVACGSDDSVDTLATETSIEALFDGDTCTITASNPSYEPTDEAGVDLLAAAPDASLAFIVTNTSGMTITGLVNRYDPALSVEEAVAAEAALAEEFGAEDGTMFPKPEWIVGAALADFGAEQLSLDENQLQYHYTLQPGLSTTLVYTWDGIWACDTGPEMLSLIEVPATEPADS